MAFCSNCGTKIDEGVKFCSVCGIAVSGIKNESVTPVVDRQQSIIKQTQSIQIDEKYCFSCGSIIKKAAEICPKCGVNQNNRNNITAIDVYCSSCGKTIKKDALMCPFCGVQQGTNLQLKKDNKGAAVASLVLGLVGLIAWLFPLAGFPVTIVGLIMGIVGQKSTKRGMATAGVIISMVGFIATIINSAIGAYQGATFQLPGTISALSVQAAIPANFVRVEGGTFNMGSPSGINDHERPVHTVTVKSFYIGKYEVTQKEWQEIMGTNPSRFRGDNLPVENVSWFDAIEYCNKRSIKEGLTSVYSGSGDNITCNWNANGYRLPTEAEWEYAAKGGNGSPGNYTYSGSNTIDDVAWHINNSGNRTHPVGTKAPNILGINDMSGNVWEWCWDWYGSYSSDSQIDPRGAVSGDLRVLRGGSWYYYRTDSARSAYRSHSGQSGRFSEYGFRLVRP